MDAIQFLKMHSLGNDFMLVGAGASEFTPDAATVRAWADRRRGIGFDQLLVVSKGGKGGEARCDVYNADGLTAKQCGNGARCVAAYLHEQGGEKRMRFVVGEQQMTAEVGAGGLVSIWLAPPLFDAHAVGFTGALDNDEDGECILPTSAGDLQFGLVSMGNPHAVVDVGQAEVAVDEIGAEVQAVSDFTEGVNVGFMRVESRNCIHLRVFERGCGETQACGSGACAAVAVGRRRGLLDGVAKVVLPGGELEIEWQGGGESMRMTGPTHHTYSGYVKADGAASDV